MKVIETAQAAGNDPVEIVWCRNTDDIGVIRAVANILEMRKNQAPFKPETLAIRVEF